MILMSASSRWFPTTAPSGLHWSVCQEEGRRRRTSLNKTRPLVRLKMLREDSVKMLCKFDNVLLQCLEDTSSSILTVSLFKDSTLTHKQHFTASTAIKKAMITFILMKC